ncbi:MAG: hypothetical protein AABX14_05460 [Candidatus Aenigmatarchaeota archaeon]
MLSDRGIKQAIDDGRLVIETFNHESLKPCSYELTMERIWRVARPHLDRDHYSIEEFVDKCCEPYEGVMLPGMNYIGISREKMLSVLHTNISTRSGIARLGIKTEQIPRDRNNTSTHLYFHINTFNTTCEIPEGVSMAQAFFDTMLPVSRDELERLISSDKIGNFQLIPENDGRYYTETPYSLLMHTGCGMKSYTGKVLRYGANNDGCFDEIGTDDLQYLLPGHFYLAHTQERVEMPGDFAGVIRRLPADFGYGYIDPNSVLVMPGTRHSIVLEMNFPQGMPVRAGEPICRMDLYQLDRHPEQLYNGRHQNQSGPQTSLSHLD